MRGYIYIISFDNTNDIYIGKTRNDIKKRLYGHKSNKNSVVYNYIKTNNINEINIHIDIIDSIDLNEDLTHLKNKYDSFIFKSPNLLLIEYKFSYLEMFHIHNYINEGKFNVINKKVDFKNEIYEMYDKFIRLI